MRDFSGIKIYRIFVYKGMIFIQQNKTKSSNTANAISLYFENLRKTRISQKLLATDTKNQ